jgi:hypothetical protein
MLNYFKNWYLRTFKAKVFKVNSGFTGHGIIETHYKFGAVHPDIKSDGDWSNVKTIDKCQNRNGLETMDCTVFGLYSCLKAIAKFKWNEDWNLSERHGGKMCGTTRQGNNMTTVLDTIRKISGVVNESDWPWTTENTWEAFYSSIPKVIILKGQDWIKRYALNYEVVPMNKQAIASALKKAPLYVCGFAWAKGNDGMYHSWGRANHCFGGMLEKINTDGSYVIKDSYPNERGSYYKTLAPDFLFGGILAIYLEKNTQYNLDYIESLMKRGLEYVLLVSPFKDFPAGAYKLNPLGITQEDVIREINDEGVKSFKEKGKLVGISSTDFSKLIV